jgi:hypothetical protein
MKTEREVAQDAFDEIDRLIKGITESTKKPSVSVQCANCKTKKDVTVAEINKGLIHCKCGGYMCVK